MREINLSIAKGGLKTNTSSDGGWWLLIGIAGLIFLIYMALKALKSMSAKETETAPK